MTLKRLWSKSRLQAKLQFRYRYLAIPAGMLMALFAWATFTSAQAQPYTTELVGTSVQGRPITAYRFGTGDTHIAFIGGIHQGDEADTTDLISKAVDYYSVHYEAIPREVTAIFIPDVNPDGHALKQRFNANGVDLNRNWPTADWQADTFAAEGLIKGGGGKAPLSEPETTAVWNYIQKNNIISTMWYHARGGMVVDTEPTAANKQRYSTQLAQLLAATTGYDYEQTWTSYEVNGDVSDFLNSKGIYSLTIELSAYDNIELTQNLAGFSAVMGFFTPRLVPETGKTINGQLLAYWTSNGGAKAMGNPTGDQQIIDGRVWQQFQKGTLTLDKSSGMVGWLPGATVPAANAAAIAQAAPPPVTPISGPNGSSPLAVDQKSSDLRNQINNLQQQASDLQKQFVQLSTDLGQPAPAALRQPGQDNSPPSADLAKAVKVVLGPNSTASVFAYERGKLVRTLGAFSGKPGFETPKGEFKIHYKNPSLETNKWYEDDGTEYILKNYVSFTGPSLNYSDDWAFHQMRIPVSGPAMGQMQAGPSHGCLALSPSDSEWIFNWADEGTPVSIY